MVFCRMRSVRMAVRNSVPVRLGPVGGFNVLVGKEVRAQGGDQFNIGLLCERLTDDRRPAALHNIPVVMVSHLSFFFVPLEMPECGKAMRREATYEVERINFIMALISGEERNRILGEVRAARCAD